MDKSLISLAGLQALQRKAASGASRYCDLLHINNMDCNTLEARHDYENEIRFAPGEQSIKSKFEYHLEEYVGYFSDYYGI